MQICSCGSNKFFFLGEQGFWPDSIGEAPLLVPSPPFGFVRAARPMQRHTEVATQLGTVPCRDLLATAADPAPVSARLAPAIREMPCSGEGPASAKNGPRCPPPDPTAAGEGEALSYGKGSSPRWNGELTYQEDERGFCRQSEGLSEPGNVGHPSRSQCLCAHRPRVIFKDLPAYAVAVTFGIKCLKSALCSRSSLSHVVQRLLTTPRTAQ